MSSTTWAPVDLGPVLAAEHGSAEPAVLLRTDGCGLLYPAHVHWVSSEPEAGKGWLGLLGCAQTMVAGDHVVYLDFEDTPGTAVDRLRSLGLADALIGERFHYLHPQEPLSDDGRRELHTLQTLRPALAVLDGITEVMALHGWDPDSGPDVALLVNELLRPLAAGDGSAPGPAVLALDHVVKAKGERGRWATGSQHKLSSVDGAAFGLEVIDPIGRDRIGRVRLVVHKDRPGRVHYAKAPASGRRDAGTLVIESREGGAKVAASIEPPTGELVVRSPVEVVNAVFIVVRQHPQGLSKAAIERAVPHRRDAVREAIRELAAKGRIKVLPTAGSTHLVVPVEVS